ncbi:MFS transporter [Sphingomonas sp. 28-63-12]|uniref:MFS transporter n=1 Tax=Sphingomonas sp. 28-63-12 TaxID=1970434 RepID=UPI000BD572EF|nr:MAG: hypothetical protein B7Y47_11225 [Sphingomonas sp. 28-63-12]
MTGPIIGTRPSQETGAALPGAHLTLVILAGAYLLSFIDRMIPALLIDPIRADLGITDTQVSLLIGFAFAIVYTTAGVPIAWLADRWSRKGVLIAGIVIWGSMTAGCGLATGFIQFFIGRMGVGLGEAALTPTAYALVTDLYPPQQRSRAMSVFVVGGAAGAGIALLAGAAVIDLAGTGGALAPWRVALLLLGGLTLLTALPISRIIEPPVSPGPRTAGNDTLKSLIVALWRERGAFAPLFIAVPLMNLTLYGAGAWGPAVLTRVYHWDAVSAGTWLGGTQVVLGIAGTVLFGWLGDRARRRGGVDQLLPMLAASCVIGAIAVGSLVVVDSAAAVILLLGAMTFATGSVGVLAPVALQAITEPDSRARTASLFLLVANLIGIGAGPSSIALVTDQLFGRPEAVIDAVALVCMPGLVIGALVTWLFAKPYADRARKLGN